jgi:AraC family transcriptional regulator of arabinose operon
MKDFDVIQPVMDRIDRSPETTLTVRDAAAQIGRSPSSLSHLFKKLTGNGFRQFQITRKIEEVDRLLQTFPQMPIKKIAERLGFQDPLYFSRLYRRHRDQSPSAKRATG